MIARMPYNRQPRRPMPTHAGTPWRAVCAILATICLLLSGCATPDPEPGPPSGIDFPYDGPILKPDGKAPHVPGSQP
jgi:hypothetical protein